MIAKHLKVSRILFSIFFHLFRHGNFSCYSWKVSKDIFKRKWIVFDLMFMDSPEHSTVKFEYYLQFWIIRDRTSGSSKFLNLVNETGLVHSSNHGNRSRISHTEIMAIVLLGLYSGSWLKSPILRQSYKCFYRHFYCPY